MSADYSHGRAILCALLLLLITQLGDLPDECLHSFDVRVFLRRKADELGAFLENLREKLRSLLEELLPKLLDFLRRRSVRLRHGWDNRPGES